jgi:hypothetical protein
MRLVNLPVFKQLDEIVLAADWNLTLVNCASYHVQAMCTENGILAEEPNEKMQNGAHHRLAPLSLVNRLCELPCIPCQSQAVWYAATGKELLTLSGHCDPVQSVAWSPDGRRLATASDDRTATLWTDRTLEGVLHRVAALHK